MTSKTPTTFVYETAVLRLFGWSLIRETYQTPTNQFSRLVIVHHSAEEEISILLNAINSGKGYQNWVRITNHPVQPYDIMLKTIENDDFARG
jgi:hypothetical protein